MKNLQELCCKNPAVIKMHERKGTKLIEGEPD